MPIDSPIRSVQEAGVVLAALPVILVVALWVVGLMLLEEAVLAVGGKLRRDLP